MNSTVKYDSTTTYFRIFLALLRRDMKVLKTRIRGILTDGIVLVCTQVLVFGNLFPLLGMPQEFISSIYIGNVVGFCLFFGFGYGLKMVFDMDYNRYIDFQIGLPLPKRWLFAEIIFYFAIEAFLVTILLLSLGIVLLGKSFVIIATNWALFILMYFLMLLFYGSFFVALAFRYDSHFFRNNIWPRRLSILFCFSSLFYIWQTVYNFSPYFAYIFLLNPLTYCAEGLRATLIGGDQFLSPYLCISMLVVFIACNCLLLSVGIIKRLDPV